MDARKIAAQFAAYTWYEQAHTGLIPEREKNRFAQENWHAFLPVAPEGLGRLLLRISRGRRSGVARRTVSPAAVAG